MDNEHIDYDKLKEPLYARLDKIGWKYGVTGGDVDEDIDIITGVHKGVSYSVNFKPRAAVYLLYKNVIGVDSWGHETFRDYFIGEYKIIGRLFAKIRALDEEMRKKDSDD